MKIEISFGSNKDKISRAETETSGTAGIRKKANLKHELIFGGVYFAIIIGLIFYGSLQSTHLAKWYVDNQNGFAIRPPKGWKTSTSQSDALVKFVDPKDSQKDIAINEDQTNLSLADYVKQMKEVLPQALPSFGINNEFDTKIGGVPAHVIDGQAQINLVWKKDRVVMLIKNGKAYTAAAATKSNDWDTEKHELFMSLKTFNLK